MRRDTHGREGLARGQRLRFFLQIPRARLGGGESVFRLPLLRKAPRGLLRLEGCRQGGQLQLPLLQLVAFGRQGEVLPVCLMVY